MTTDTQERFKDVLKKFDQKLTYATLTAKDGIDMYALADNLLMRYEEVRKSRDKWKSKFEELKKGIRTH